MRRRPEPSMASKYEFDQYGAMTAEWSLDVAQRIREAGST